jgi:hypothetical protein
MDEKKTYDSVEWDPDANLPTCTVDYLRFRREAELELPQVFERVFGSKDAPYSFDQMQTLGVLWLINRVVFHPRGVSLCFEYEKGSREPIGWFLQGFDGPVDVALPEGANVKDLFNMVEELINRTRSRGRMPNDDD